MRLTLTVLVAVVVVVVGFGAVLTMARKNGKADSVWMDELTKSIQCKDIFAVKFEKYATNN